MLLLPAAVIGFLGAIRITELVLILFILAAIGFLIYSLTRKRSRTRGVVDDPNTRQVRKEHYDYTEE